MIEAAIIGLSIITLGVGYYFAIHKPREKRRLEIEQKTKFANSFNQFDEQNQSNHTANTHTSEQVKDNYSKNNENYTTMNTFNTEQNNQNINVVKEQNIIKHENINEVRNINTKTIVEFAEDDKLSITHLYMYLVQDLSEQGKKEALELPDKFRLEAGKSIIRQRTIVFIDRIIRNYDKKIQEHEYHYNFNNKIGTEDTADEIATLKKILMEERDIIHKFRKDLVDNSNDSGHLMQQYMILEHSYLNGFMSAVASLSMLKLGYNDYNKLK